MVLSVPTVDGSNNHLSSVINCTVSVDYDRTHEDVISVAGRIVYVDEVVIKTMPRDEGAKIIVLTFFKVGRRLKNGELQNEFSLRNLRPAIPAEIFAHNEIDLTFADTHPNITYWDDTDGVRYFASCVRRGNERQFGVSLFCGDTWGDDWWFAGVAHNAV